ncbi:MAG: PQQ-binding-like beta-propeller repeat protein [Candidatus Omnitrophica bacterium]|nr:PQQ-binding-like beta-propeller repeat protein [Candidatus Omnitrophota bacterium]
MHWIFCRMKRGRSAVVCGWMLTLAVINVIAADQPQWGQRWSRNLVSGETNLPETFDLKTGKNIEWSVQLGSETHATPVVAHGRVFIGTNNNHPRDPKHQGDRGVLMCFNEANDELLWQLVVPKREGDIYLDWPNSGLCSPPTIEGDRVYVLSNRGEVMCLDINGLANGNDGPFQDEGVHMTPSGTPPMQPGPLDADIIWIFDLVSGVGIHSHDAAHASILQLGQYLYLNTCNGVDNTHRRIRSPDAPSLVVLDKATGRLVAQDAEHIGPRIFHCTWSSPAFGEVNGKPEIIFAGGDGVVYAFEPFAPADGNTSSGVQKTDNAGPVQSTNSVAALRKLWQFDCDPTAPKTNVHRFVGNRRESPSNIKSMPVFHQNRVYVTVGGDLWWGKNQAWLKCIDATQSGDITHSGELWSYPLERHCMCTPAVYHGLVFVGDSGRRIHCVDADTGRPYWTQETQGEVWASPLVADGKVYFATRQGEFWVFAASKEKKVLSTIDLGEPISSTPVAANGVLYVTTMSHLYAIRKSSP